MRGDADRGVFLVVDENGERIGFLVVEVSTYILVVWFFFPVQEYGNVFARVLFIQYEAGIFVEIAISFLRSGEAEFHDVCDSLRKGGVAKIVGESGAETQRPLLEDDDLLPRG